MAASYVEIRRWFDEGVKAGATHMLLVCDTYDYEDYPVYIMPGDDPIKTYGRYHYKNMQRVLELYNLAKNSEEQILSDRLVFNL